MKKLKAIFLVALTAMVATGCTMREEMDITINKDKSMDFSIVMAMDDELISAMTIDENGEASKDLTDKEKWDLIDEAMENSTGDVKGYTKSKYEKDGFKGYAYTKKIKNIDEVTADKDEKASLEAFSDEKNPGKLFTKNKNGNYVLSTDIPDMDSASELNGYGITLEFNLVVNLPEKAISNNATQVSEDGKTLTWDLTKAEKIELEFNIEEQNFMAKNGKIVLIGIALVVLGAGACLIISKKSKEKKAIKTLNENVMTNAVIEDDTNLPNDSSNPQV